MAGFILFPQIAQSFPRSGRGSASDAHVNEACDYSINPNSERPEEPMANNGNSTRASPLSITYHSPRFLRSAQILMTPVWPEDKYLSAPGLCADGLFPGSGRRILLCLGILSSTRPPPATLGTLSANSGVFW